MVDIKEKKRKLKEFGYGIVTVLWETKQNRNHEDVFGFFVFSSNGIFLFISLSIVLNYDLKRSVYNNCRWGIWVLSSHSDV